MSTEEKKAASFGRWKSISTEVRPSSTKTAEGKTTPFYLTRSFELLPGDVFELVVTNYADPYGKVAIVKIDIRGHIEWRVAETQSIFKRAFPPFGLADGQVFQEYDLIYVLDKFMFWGARHVDGRGFDTEANRPDTLQIPMVKVG